MQLRRLPFFIGVALSASAARVDAQSAAQQSSSSAERRTWETAEGNGFTARASEIDAERDLLTFHRSNYFVTGFTADTQVKFQFSVKYDFWPSASHHTVYFAYTQKSLWDLYEQSSPFRESNYAPEAFYAHYHTQRQERAPGCGLFSEQVGVEHESNGEASDASRGWNRVFVDVEATCKRGSLYGTLGLRLWYPLGSLEKETIAKTQGYGELTLGVGFDDDDSHMNGLVALAVRKGASRELERGNLTLDARWRPTYQRLIGEAWKFAPYLWLQWFVGYGETLGTYDGATNSVRLGIGLTDRAGPPIRPGVSGDES